jgi:hypothetical protein
MEQIGNRKAVFGKETKAAGSYLAGLYLRTSYVLGLQTFGPAFHLELHLRALLKSAIPIHLDSREMHENIIAVRALNESVALSGVKPFDNTFFSHC